ncbi:MAG: cell division protein FtsA [Patescibacteria group bacterium]|nr:cell division protein FtsA [Patescibacteria group bacterium]MDE2116623.1 cell division protein FtsA [Patescibacteria group bacterium]
MRKNIAAGIDIGTYQVKVVVSESDPEQPEKLPRIIGSGLAESRGLRHGYIVNTRDVTKSVLDAVAQAEKASGFKIKRAFISIGGISLQSIIGTGAIVISRGDSEITQLDIEKATAGAERNVPAASMVNRRIIHTVPLSFKIDGKPIMSRTPIGLKGNKLEARVLFITCLSQHLDDLIDAITDAGIEVLDVVASPIAGALVTLSKNQKVAGCLLANIGAETVSIVVYENNLPISLEVFPIGSTDITNDIALGLKLPIEDAESLKRGSLSNAQVSKKKLDEIIAARLSDIFDLVEAHLKKIDRNGLLPAGIIITGGGSGVATIEDLARAALKLPAKIVLKDSTWSVAYGLTILGIGGDDYADQGMSKPAGAVARKVGSWFKQFLP